MLTKNHEKLTDEVAAHIDADAVRQGNYWNGSKGCFIGCLAHSPKAEVLQERFGLPLPLVRICESIFEGLPAAEAKAFFAAFPAAVGRDGKDLSLVHWKFLAAELRALPPVPDHIQDVIDPVIEGMDLLASGKEWRQAAAAADVADAAAEALADRAAASAADAAFAASVAAEAAAGAARAAARAARTAARQRQRDTILRLISDAA